MIISSTASKRAVAILAGIAGVVLAAAISGGGSERRAASTRPMDVPRTGISADFGYEVSDPSLIAGDSFFIVVGRVDRQVRVDDNRTVFEVSVKSELKGETPDSILVSQLGYVEGDLEWELENYPLMQLGHHYVMGLTVPSPSEPADALILLSSEDSGNKVEVTGADDPAVSWYARMAARARSPYSARGKGYEERSEQGRDWLASHPGYVSPGLPAPQR